MAKPTPLVSPLNWLALVAIAALLLVTGIWAFTGTIPRMVDGHGIILRDSDFGIFEIAGNQSGTLANVFVKEGDVVAEEQPIAELRLEVVRKEIAAAEQALATAETADQRLSLETQLRQLRSQLEARRLIRSAHAGRVIEVAVSPGDVIKPAETVARLESLSGNYEALLYVSALEGKKVQNGMEARIMPTTAHAERSGYLRARVSYVSAQPITRNYLISEFGGNERLADWLLERGSQTEVVLQLLPDSTQPGGYSWSTGKPAAPIESGLLLDGQVIFDRVRPMSWLFSHGE